jgi:hypothetical protein
LGGVKLGLNARLNELMQELTLLVQFILSKYASTPSKLQFISLIVIHCKFASYQVPGVKQHSIVRNQVWQQIENGLLLISIKGVVSCVVLKGPRGTTNIQLFSGT